MSWYKKAQDNLGDDNLLGREPIDEVSPQSSINEEIVYPSKKSPHRAIYPNVRNGWTLEKIKRELKKNQSNYAYGTFLSEIMNFSSPEEFEDNLYYHGTGSGVSGGLKAGFTQIRNGVGGGGGYGEQYYTISLSKNKNLASNFTADSSYGTVYPVILKKDATIISMPKIQDSLEIEPFLVELWTKGIDAVKIGDWSSEYSEQELVVLNPKSLVIGKGDSFSVYQKQKFVNPTLDDLSQMWLSAADEYKQRFADINKNIPLKGQRRINDFKNYKDLYLNQQNENI